MKYIEENFKDTNVQSLSDNEIRYLSEFLEKQISIQSVECILLKPKYKEICRRYYDDSYCSIQIIVITQKESRDLKIIEESILETERLLPFLSYIPTNEFDFVIDDVDSYKSESIIIRSWSECDLVSSYILFDRNGYFENMQDELRERKTPYVGLSKIDNINKLCTEPFEKRLARVNDINQI